MLSKSLITVICTFQVSVPSLGHNSQSSLFVFDILKTHHIIYSYCVFILSLVFHSCNQSIFHFSLILKIYFNVIKYVLLYFFLFFCFILAEVINLLSTHVYILHWQSSDYPFFILILYVQLIVSYVKSIFFSPYIYHYFILLLRFYFSYLFQ